MKIYDATEVTVNFGGFPIESGYDDGDFVKITPEAKDFESKVGTDGEVTRSKTSDKRTVVKIILMQTGSGNAILSTLNNVDRAAGNGAGVVPILIRDRQGLSLFASAQAWIEGPPEVTYGREASAREWSIMCANPERFDGGN